VIVALASASLPFLTPASTVALPAVVFAFLGSSTSTSTSTSASAAAVAAAEAAAAAAAVLALFGARTAVVDVLAVLAELAVLAVLPAQLRAGVVAVSIAVATAPPAPIALMQVLSILLMQR
jgi:hypothetical protein